MYQKACSPTLQTNETTPANATTIRSFPLFFFCIFTIWLMCIKMHALPDREHTPYLCLDHWRHNVALTIFPQNQINSRFESDDSRITETVHTTCGQIHTHTHTHPGLAWKKRVCVYERLNMLTSGYQIHSYILRFRFWISHQRRDICCGAHAAAVAQTQTHSHGWLMQMHFANFVCCANGCVCVTFHDLNLEMCFAVTFWTIESDWNHAPEMKSDAEVGVLVIL